MISISSASKNINYLGYYTTKKEEFNLTNNVNTTIEIEKLEENNSYYTPKELFEIEKFTEKSINNIKNYYNSNHNNYDINNKDYKYSVYCSEEIIYGTNYDFGVYIDIQEIEKIMPLEEFEKLVTKYIDMFKQDGWFGSCTDEFTVGAGEHIVKLSEYFSLAEITGKAFRTDKGVVIYDEDNGWDYYKEGEGGFIAYKLAQNFHDILSNIAKYISENYVKNLTFDYWDIFLDDLEKMPNNLELKKSFNDLKKSFEDTSNINFSKN